MSFSIDKPTATLALAASAFGLAAYNFWVARSARRVITTGASAFYNGAHEKDGIVYVSGQVAVCGKTADGKPLLKAGGVKAETRQCLENLRAILVDAGSSMDSVLKATCYLGDISMYAEFNEVYLEFFADAATRPARVCFAVDKLPLGAAVEVECTAYVN